MRRTVGPWRNTDMKGNPLRHETLRGSLTQVAGFMGAICKVREEEYLLRRLAGDEHPDVAEANRALDSIRSVATRMIASLHWADFETLVDLMFARMGWQRVSRVGGSQKDTDLVLIQPATGEAAFVQVKSKAGQKVLDDYVQRFERGPYQRMFFVCHSPSGALVAKVPERIHVWTGERLADVTVRAGLFDWLVERSG